MGGAGGELANHAMGPLVLFGQDLLGGVFSGPGSRWQQMTASYETRRLQGLANVNDSQVHYEEWNRIAASDVKSALESQLARRAEAKANALGQQWGLFRLKPVQALGAAVYVAQGRPVVVRLLDDLELTSRSTLVNRSGQLAFQSPWVSTAFDYNFNAPEHFDPARPDIRDERFKISLSRWIPYVHVNAGFNYGSSTQGWSATILKPINEKVACEWNSNSLTETQVKLRFEHRL